MTIRNAFKVAMNILTRVICPFRDKPIQSEKQKLRADLYRTKKQQRMAVLRAQSGRSPKTEPRRTLIPPRAGLNVCIA